jgi:hypothetical protein
VAENKKLYLSLPKKQKMLVAQNLVLGVRSLQPPGRFLQKDPKTGLWEDIGDAKAQDKASQALREGAPDIRDVLVLSSKDARSQQDDKSTINPFFSDHVVEVEGDAVVIFDAISHAAETENFLSQMHNPKLFSTKLQKNEPITLALQRTTMNNAINNSGTHSLNGALLFPSTLDAQHDASGFPFFHAAKQNAMSFPTWSPHYMLDPLKYIDTEPIPPQHLMANFVHNRMSNSLNYGAGQTFPYCLYRPETDHPQPPPLAANGESKKQEWPKESGKNDDAVKASEPLHPSACSFKDDKCSLYANAEKNYVTEYQISGSDNDSFEAEMEAIASLPSSADFLPAVALASAANAYSMCREYESKIMKKSYDSHQSSYLPLHVKDLISSDTPKPPISRACAKDLQHLLKPISIADFLNAPPLETKNCKMSLVDSDDEDEDATWEIIKKSLSEHNRPTNSNTNTLQLPPLNLEPMSSTDSSAFPIPLSRGTSLSAVSALWNIMGGESGGSATGLLTLSRACSQTLFASSESSCQEVDENARKSNNSLS